MTEERALAKLNISLDVGKKRDDGYHDMVMIMQTVSLADNVTVEVNESGVVAASSNLAFVPNDDRNLAVKAAKLYLSRIGESAKGASIKLLKRIPVGAGMAGGSADAAAVLRAMNREFGNALSTDELTALAVKTGSDVAFCLLGGTMLATGRGEVLRPLAALPECSIAVCKPRFSVSTPELFAKLDRVRLRRHPDTNGIISALESGDLPGVCRRMYNVFEDVDDRRMRTVADIKRVLTDAGALGAVMTGTGSAVFGIFEEHAAAESVITGLKKEYGFATIVKPKAIRV